MPRAFDLFLSHNSEDKPVVREIAAALKHRRFMPWLDADELTPGRSWQDMAEEAIQTCRAAAIFIGPSGIGPWERQEMRACLTQAVRRDLAVIPVLLPGATKKLDLPLFLGERTWVDLRTLGVCPEGLDLLIWGITGKKPRSKPRAKPVPAGQPPLHNLPFPPLGDLLKGRDEELRELAESHQGDSQPKAIVEVKTTPPLLFLGASPKGLATLRLDHEYRAIELALRHVEHQKRFDLRSQPAVRPADLQSALLYYRPRIVHFSGHGEADGIYLENEAGEPHKVKGSALARILGVLKAHIRCVVLNACYSQDQAEAIAKDIDCVVGMSAAIGDKAAIQFSPAFYQALAFGSSVQEAFDLACAQIDLAGLEAADTPKLIALRQDPKEIFLVDELAGSRPSR